MKTLTLLFRILVPAYDVVYQTSLFPDLIKKKSFQAELLYRYVPMTFFLNWLYNLVPLIGGLIMPILILIGAWHIGTHQQIKDKVFSRLIFLVLAQWGFLGLWSFVGHTFLADMVAQSIGWDINSPFQLELAFYHLGLALATFYLLWYRSKHLLAGLIITKSVFLFGAMGIHMYHLIVNMNYSTGNIGPQIIFADLIFPVVVIWYFVYWMKIDESIS
jgi:hypothetical protein